LNIIKFSLLSVLYYSDSFGIVLNVVTSGGIFFLFIFLVILDPYLIILMSTLLATLDSSKYHFIINIRDQQINDITFVRNSAIPTKYGTVDKVELYLKILSTNCLCSPSLSLIFSYIERPPRRVLNIK